MDTTEWNPATDKYLDVKYNKSNVFAGKAAAKEALQAEVGLDVSATTPLFGYIGRLEEQKGVDILMKVRTVRRSPFRIIHVLLWKSYVVYLVAMSLSAGRISQFHFLQQFS
jgi:hypothetical protein